MKTSIAAFNHLSAVFAVLSNLRLKSPASNVENLANEGSPRRAARLRATGSHVSRASLSPLRTSLALPAWASRWAHPPGC